MSKSIKFLIIDTYYPKLLISLYSKLAELGQATYIEQRDFIMGQCFGTADFYSKNLKALGCEAEEIVGNSEVLQRQWALENGVKLNRSFLSRMVNKLPRSKKFFPKHDILLNILAAQIKRAKPDVLYMQDLWFCPPSFLWGMKKYVKLLVGQIACPLPAKGNFAPYDLIVSSLPHYVDKFRSWGIKSEFFKIGFEGSIANLLPKGDLKYEVVHIGGYGPLHLERNQLLEDVAKSIDIKFWGYGEDNLPSGSRILRNYNGESWGIDRCRIFAQSKMVITKHIASVAGKYCNNMTLYEATGCGTLLITDYKENLPELFVPDQEVVTYRSAEEAINKIKYYLTHEDERSKIARAGQIKTLSEYTYYNRMVELVGIIGKYL